MLGSEGAAEGKNPGLEFDIEICEPVPLHGVGVSIGKGGELYRSSMRLDAELYVDSNGKIVEDMD